MKNLIFLFLLAALSAKSQVTTGKYINSVGQELIVSNLNDGGFEFKISWGVNDEWGCLFSAEGSAIFSDNSLAYFGDDIETSSLNFEIKGDQISVVPSPDFIGSDCASYGESLSESIVVFKKSGSNSSTNMVIAKYSYSEFGDFPHIIFNDEKGNEWDFGTGENNFGSFDFGQDNDFVTNEKLVGKSFKITLENRKTKTYDMDGVTEIEVETPTIIKIEIID